MSVANLSTAVKIRGEEFSLISSPDEGSDLVQHLKKLTLGQVNLKDLSGNLGRVGKLVHMAYFAAKGCGYGDGMVDLKMSIYELGVGMTKLGSMSSSTVSSFRSSSYEVMQEIQAAHEYLLDGYADDALDSLDSLFDTAKRMAEEANNLKEKFTKKNVEVIAIIRKLEEAENVRGVTQKEKQEERDGLKVKLEQYEKRKEEIKKREEEAKLKKEKYEEKRDEAIEQYEEPTLMQLLRQKVKGAPPDKIKEYKAISIEQYEIETEQRKLFNEELEQELNDICKLEACKDAEGDLNTAIDCLRKVRSALQHLETVLSTAAEFWETLARGCENLSRSKIKNAIEKEKNSDEDMKLQKWHSNSFKMSAVTYAAKWVALYCICNEYLENVRLTQEQLRKYNIENPSVNEAKEMLPILIKEVKEDTLTLMKVNREQILVANEKIQEIEADQTA